MLSEAAPGMETKSHLSPSRSTECRLQTALPWEDPETRIALRWQRWVTPDERVYVSPEDTAHSFSCPHSTQHLWGQLGKTPTFSSPHQTRPLAGLWLDARLVLSLGRVS